VNVGADVALVGHDRLARVHAHAHRDDAVRQRRLRVSRGGERVSCPCERDEERVALRVDLDAGVEREGGPQPLAVIRQGRRVALRAESVEQLRRPTMSVKRNVTVPAGRSGMLAAIVLRSPAGRKPPTATAAAGL